MHMLKFVYVQDSVLIRFDGELIKDFWRQSLETVRTGLRTTLEFASVIIKLLWKHKFCEDKTKLSRIYLNDWEHG